MSDLARMKELVTKLNIASKEYYANDTEIMSNYEYDKLYDELVALEQSLNCVLSGSPTANVGYEAVQELEKEKHLSPMLSLSKTKSREELKAWLNGQDALLSWKLDGLTIVLTYESGMLQKAVTRGNGEVGEVITNNAKVFANLPHRIPFEGSLILRGEAVITYSDFEKLNASIQETEAKFKNPRNLCSGSVRQLNNKITKDRSVSFYAFSLVSAMQDDIPYDFKNDRENQFKFLREQGFDTVSYVRVKPETIIEEIEGFAERIKTYDVPSDGLVLTYCDIEYGNSLGRTAKFPRDSFAFKWEDETAVTTLREIEWSPSRTGLINPVAIFDPVELEGTTVTRASVHNLSIMKNMNLGINDQILVYKANMIIPQIAENLTKSGDMTIPDSCPACGKQTKVQKENDVETLVCTNSECVAKKIKSFTLMVSRDALNIDGLSEATLEKFIGKGFIHSFADVFHLEQHKEEIVEMEGFGQKSYDNLIKNLDIAKKTTLPKFIYALGITGIGVANAKMLSKAMEHCYDKIKEASIEQLAAVDGIGEVLAKGIMSYFNDPIKCENADKLYEVLEIIVPDQEQSSDVLQNQVFVITGSVEHYKNRNELKEVIENLGGKVTGSVSANTNYLINNDLSSTSGKNKKAKELSIPIINEEMFLELIKEGNRNAN